MRPTLRIGDTGDAVRTVQNWVGVADDGIFGPVTEAAVVRYQQQQEILADGIVGPATWAHLLGQRGATYVWHYVEADQYGDGYNNHKLRTDVASQYERLRRLVNDLGGVITSSGSRRRLNAPVGSNRSATSLHYVGRALDLYVYSGMVDPDNDPYVVEKDGERHWIVWARAEGGTQQTINATLKSGERVKTSGRFVNLTQIMSEFGFERIGARPAFFRQTPVYGAAEWWHFQCEKGLEPGVTTFGDELIKLYTFEELEATPPWRHANKVWQEDWF